MGESFIPVIVSRENILPMLITNRSGCAYEAAEHELRMSSMTSDMMI